MIYFEYLVKRILPNAKLIIERYGDEAIITIKNFDYVVSKKILLSATYAGSEIMPISIVIRELVEQLEHKIKKEGVK